MRTRVAIPGPYPKTGTARRRPRYVFVTAAVTVSKSASVSVAVAAVSAENVTTTHTASVSVTTALAASLTSAFARSASVSAGVAVVSSASRAVPGSCSVAVGLSLSAAENARLIGAASVSVSASTSAPESVSAPRFAALTVHVTPAATEHAVHLVSASVTLRVRPTARVKGTAASYDSTYVGRFQQGQAVPLFEVTRTRKGVPQLPPLLAPVATVYDLDTHTKAEVFVPNLHDPSVPEVFAGPLRLGADFPPGRYAVNYRWLLGGDLVEGPTFFEVVAGGDAVGPLIAGKVLDFDESPTLVCQSGGGRILSARGPSIDDGGVL